MKTKIAIVDDHDMFRSGIISLLRDDENLEIIFEAANGVELLKHLKTKKPDLVLMDIQMPEMDGIQATVLLKELYPDVKIIITSTHKEVDFIVDLMNKGANSFVPKNTSFKVLEEAIYNVINNGYHYSESITAALLNGGLISNKDANNEELSEREIEIVRLICAQKSIKQIAEILDISPRTVDSHKNNIFLKTGAKNIIGVALFAVQNKLIN
jgi:DNA-binding NarL/FixJ family response regulator